MENVGSVNIEQSTSSADTDLRNAHNSVGCNRSRCSFSAKTDPAIIPGKVERWASFRQDVPRNGDSEISMNCETRWLQLFRRVEEQCQEQIVAQQKQFCHQILRIQNEIRHLMKLQNQNVCLCTKGKRLPIFPSSDCPMGLQFEHELLVGRHTSNETESCPQASPDIQVQGARGTLGGPHPSGVVVHQECVTNSVSLSSGYGTCSAADLSPGKSKDIQVFMENSQDLTKGQDGASSVQVDLIPAKRDSTHTTGERCPSLKVDGDAVFPAESERNVNEGQCGKTNSKSLTSWAQKLRKSQLKRTSVEEVATQAVQGQEQTPKLAFEDTNPIAAEPPSYTFCPSRPKGSQNSIASDNSGLTYWKLDEKELYHSLPEKFSNEFSIASANMSSEQSSCCDEMKPSSLKDIYHKKQQENRHLIDWNLSLSQSTHPPEILTLDPTLHMRPGQQNPGLPSHGFYDTPEKVCFSPDSMMEPAFSTHLDTDSFSRASSVYSPPSVGSPRDILCTTALCVDPWNSCGFQSNANTLRSSPVAYAHSGNDVLNMEEEDNLTLTPSSAAQCQPLSSDNIFPEYNISPACVEDPTALSRIRQNLREKHARHIADLRAYYDSEIQSLKQQLEASHKPPSKDLKKINQTLADRCDQLETTLNDANNRLRTLENKNNTLEMEVTDWKGRFCAASNTTKALQERIEEMRTGGKEKDNTISRLKRRVKELEEAFEKAYKLSDNKDARLKEENKMFQNLLGEYESLGKEHERVKDTLNITENKLLDAHAQISDLKRTVSKLEAQIKQLEHENGLKLRQLADNPFGTSYSHSILTSSDVSRRKWLIPGAEYSIFTGQPLEAPENPKDNRLKETYAARRYYSPPEKDCSSSPSQTNDTAKKEPEPPETPIIKAFKELEERKASKSRGAQAGKEVEVEAAPAKATSRRPTVGFDETALGARRSPEKGKDHQRHKRYSSPNGQRSSSLPPSNRKLNTPTRREIMIAPVAVTSSPKRSPKENLSPGFSHLLSRNKNTTTRFDILLDDLEVAPLPATPYSSPRKRLQFLSVGDTGGAKNGMRGPAGEEESSAHPDDLYLPSPGPAACEADFKYIARFKTLAEIEKLFDDLTHEKQQIESQLSRIPSAGGRMSLQARLNQEALEDHLERISRELGSIRMVLKKFLVLRTSANI